MRIRFAVLLAGSLVCTGASAENNDYDLCILQHLKGAQLDMATHLIKQACHEIFISKGARQRRNLEYNQCLLENLVDVESAQAVIEINTACENLYGQ